MAAVPSPGFMPSHPAAFHQNKMAVYASYGYYPNMPMMPYLLPPSQRDTSQDQQNCSFAAWSSLCWHHNIKATLEYWFHADDSLSFAVVDRECYGSFFQLLLRFYFWIKCLRNFFVRLLLIIVKYYKMVLRIQEWMEQASISKWAKVSAHELLDRLLWENIVVTKTKLPIPNCISKKLELYVPSVGWVECLLHRIVEQSDNAGSEILGKFFSLLIK